MKDNLTEIVFILDRSGSMRNLTNDTIGGFNAFIDQQKKEPGEAVLTTVLFDDQYEILHNGVNLKDVKELTGKEYFARGCTALLDAIGKTINTVGEQLNKTNEENKPSKVIFVITTDGFENASKEFTQPQIKEMIEHQTNKYNWQFMFLGANIDAVATASSYGISGQFASNYTASSIGTDSLYRSVSKSVASYRTEGKIDADWKDELK
jgi:uncharacterized protein YegL